MTADAPLLVELLTQPIQGLPLWNWILQAVGLLSAYAGAELNSRMRISGFYVWTVGNVALIVVNAIAGLWLLALLNVLYLHINARGVLRWSKTFPDQAPGWLARTDSRQQSTG